MTEFQELITKLDQFKYDFINDIFKQEIKKVIIELYPKLNRIDLNILQNLTIYLIEDISKRYHFEKRAKYYLQWKKNNSQDILAVSLMLLPFINDKDNDKRWYHNMIDLNQILYNHIENDIPDSILQNEITKVLKSDMSFSNFSIGLLNENKSNSALELIDSEGTKLIYHILHHNFCSILETLKITNGKLYINWLNIVPVVDYKRTKIYETSKNELATLKQNIGSPVEFRQVLRNNKGLWFGDYYNVYHNGYYQSIKKIKWTIYNKRMKGAKKGIYMIQYLNELIKLDQMFILDNYDNLNKFEQIEFDESIRKISFNLENNIPLYLDSAFEKDIFKNIIIFLVNNSTERFLLKHPDFNKFKLSEEDDQEDLDEIEKMVVEKTNKKFISDELLVNALNRLQSENQTNILWNYLKQVIYQLKTTQYGRFLIRKNKINKSFFYFPVGMDTDHNINLKNIYNIAKALSHTSDWELLSSNYKTLLFDSKFDFFQKYLNDIPFNNWLKITNNINIQEGDNDKDMNQIMNNIANGWNKIKKFLVWDYLTYNGLLSEFKVNLDITDQTQLPIDTNIKKKVIWKRLEEKINKKNYLEKAHYFLTNEPYKELQKFHNIQNEKSYFEALTSELLYYSFYAMDWISQINFFNHYINHQIMYVTGSTGTGKSTQVPKLLLYSLKMYDYNPIGKVICTQPRIPPTVDNATWISKEMGVQNIRKSKKKLDIKTNQYYLQYKHQHDKHTKENCNHLTIRMVTDGTLLEELTTNPLMKEKIKKPSKDNSGLNSIDFIYSLQNKYAIIIVDEAHEHNTNMDIILTLARQTCFFNNSIRLVIVSATMDDDEPIYRSYFNLIDDNVVYPLKQPLILHPILDIENFLIDSGYLDRRIHISPPGQTTQYRIDEYYNKEIENKLSKTDHANNSIIAQEESYKTILEICDKSPTGEILLFLTGKYEIKRALNYLNQSLPSGTIALPFFSGINERYRDMISKININKKNIRNFRENIETAWDEEYIDAKDVAEGTYKRVVIIATNVAEASITVPGLKYVVDTGYAKVNSYDETLGTSSLNVEEISEASRIQRKGRVGRIANGEVYYMYGENKRADNKPKYGITQGDFSGNFLKLAVTYDKSKVNDLLIYDPKYIIGKKIDAIIQKQYIYHEIDYIVSDMFRRKGGGCDHIQLIDRYGRFYIIHPFENKIKRNIKNEIIEYNDIKQVNSIDRKDWNNILQDVVTKMLYLNIEGSDIREIDIEVAQYKKTVYNDRINETIQVMEAFRLERFEAIYLLIGTGYNIQLEVCEILAMLRTIDYNISSLAPKNVRNPKILEFDKLYQQHQSDSDLISIHNICKMLRTYMNKLLVYQIYNKQNVINKYKREYEQLVEQYKKLRFTINPPAEFEDSWNILNWLKENGKLNSKTGFLYWLSRSKSFIKTLKEDLMKNYSNIEKVCLNENLNYNKILDYYDNLINIIISIKTTEKDLEQDYGEVSPFEWVLELGKNLLKSLFNPTIENKIITTFVFSLPINIAIRMETSDYLYTLIKKGLKTNVPVLFKDNQINTLCTSVGNYLYYVNIKKNKDGTNEIKILSNIHPKMLAYIYPLHYNPKNIKNEYVVDGPNNTKDIKRFYGNNWDNFIYLIKNHFTLTYFPLNNSVELPVINMFMKNTKVRNR